MSLACVFSACLATASAVEPVGTNPLDATTSVDSGAEQPSGPDISEPAIVLAANYTFDVWYNAKGGQRRGKRYLDNLDITLTVDGSSAFGWRGTTLFMHGLYNNGRSLTDDLVGDLQVVSNIDAGVKAARLYEAWIEKRFDGDRASVKLGLYDLNSEFDTNDTNTLFVNSSHGIGPDFSQSGRNGPSIFPSTSLALRVDYRFTDNLLARAAILDAVPGDPDRPKRTVVKLRNDEGALLVGEIEYADQMTKIAAGAWGYTAPFDDQLASAVAGYPVTRTGNGGLYVFAERKLSGPSGQGKGLSAWARLGVTDSDFNVFDRAVTAGVAYSGPFRGRPADKIGLAVAYAKIGRPYREALVLRGERSQVHETNMEITYRAQVAPWLSIQPDLQYIINPGGNPFLEDALVLGLRTEFSF